MVQVLDLVEVDLALGRVFVVDESHPCYTVKYLKNKPIRDLSNDTFLHLQQVRGWYHCIASYCCQFCKHCSLLQAVDDGTMTMEFHVDNKDAPKSEI